jgi:hypothetical protein
MASSEETFQNVNVNKNIVVSDLTVTGTLEVPMDQFHHQNWSTFYSNESLMTFDYVLHIDDNGTYIELYEQDRATSNETMITQINEPDKLIKFTDMHYNHYINETMHYKFVSDRNIVLLSVNDKWIPLETRHWNKTLNLNHSKTKTYKQDSFREIQMDNIEHPHFFSHNKIVNLLQRVNYSNSYENR